MEDVPQNKGRDIFFYMRFARSFSMMNPGFHILFFILYILYSLYHRNGAYKTDVAFLLLPWMEFSPMAASFGILH